MSRNGILIYAALVFVVGVSLGALGAHLLTGMTDSQQVAKNQDNAELPSKEPAAPPATDEPEPRQVDNPPPGERPVETTESPTEPAEKQTKQTENEPSPEVAAAPEPQAEPDPTSAPTQEPVAEQEQEPKNEPEPATTLILPEDPEHHGDERPRAYEETPPEPVFEAAVPTEPAPENTPAPALEAIPEGQIPNWRKFALRLSEIPPGPQIAIVIDDAGVDRKRTAQAIGLRGPMTISFLTYASRLKSQVEAARQAGHEIMMHIPMEPRNTSVDPGPKVLATVLSDVEIADRLDWGLTRIVGFVGINNHMGSRFTDDRRGMRLVMEALRRRGYMFLDSRTSQNSVGATIAREYQVPFAVRNVFLDHEPTVGTVNKQLKHLEALARRQGYAVAIGHPRDATIEALADWLPVAAEKGLVLVPITAIIAKRAGLPQLTVKLDTN